MATTHGCQSVQEDEDDQRGGAFHSHVSKLVCPPRNDSQEPTMMTIETSPNSSRSDPDRVCDRPSSSLRLGPTAGNPTDEASCYFRPL